MTQDQEMDLFTALGRIEQKIDNCVSSLISHTIQDGQNFTKLEIQVDDFRTRELKAIEEKISALALVVATKDGEDIATARAAANSGGKAGALIGGAISLIVAGISAYFSPR